ncbi:MAG: folate-binding protein YgfZ [Alphaproteobacteria bacterium]|nr:folate-binding protein YgfZ [Alphaproteobacteria bacterium]
MLQSKFVKLEDRGILAVVGPDRRVFLQGLVSNDVEKVSGERACYAALLTAQGKYLHDFIMTEHEDAIWLEVEMARLADLKRRLSIYRLRAKVTLDERPDLAVIAVFGGAVAAALGLPEEPGAGRSLAGGVAFIDPRLAALGGRCVLPRNAAPQALAEAGLAAGDFAEYDRLRLVLGVPDGSRDLVLDKSILLEAGFDELNGVDWQKGCYIGQELTARTKYRGLIKKRLFPVRIEGPAPAPGTILMQGGREAGEMRSSRDDIGLALLRLDAADQASQAGDACLAPITPDWMRLPV